MSNLRPRFWVDQSGAALVQFLLVLPLLLALTMGIVDLVLWIVQFNLAAKATHIGARYAVVSNPVTDVTDVNWIFERIGDPCLDSATGLPIVSGGVANCPDISTTCTADPSPAATGMCTNGFAFNNAAFVQIHDKMRGLFPRIERQNVVISYQTTGLGFVGRPGGLPMDVTVSLKCLTYKFLIMDSLFGWAAPANACGAGFPAGWPIPASKTTLPSEDLVTN